jgi:CBS domain-containing protein
MISVSDLLRGKGNQVWSIKTSDSLLQALELLKEKDVGALPVMKSGKLAGIFSERDFARAAAMNPELSMETPISDLMTANVLSVKPSDSVETCMKIMTEHHIRHLPVMDGDMMVGIVSIGDAVKRFVTDQKTFIASLEDYISGRW